jgi:hypothetical protein
LLRASVPQKIIGDLLGHRSTEATIPYLKLATEDLRAITIRETKFFHTRILPLPDSVMAELRSYIHSRRSAGALQDPQSGLFWHDQGNDRYTAAAIGWLLVDILAAPTSSLGPGEPGPVCTTFATRWS